MRPLVLFACIALISCGPGKDNDQMTGNSIEFKIITVGEQVNLEEHAVTGRITVFDFYADWCPPCKKLEVSLKNLKEVYGDRMEVKKLDLVEWQSPLAQQFGIKDLPYLIIYGPDGKPMKVGTGDMLMEGPSNRILPLLIAELNR